MSAKIINAVCECKLAPTLKAVAKELAWFADDNGEHVFPSVETLTWRTGFERRTVQLQIRELEAMTVLHRITSGFGGRHRSTQYRFDLATLAALPRARQNRQVHNQPFAAKGEPQGAERANATTEKGARGSPKEDEHEKRRENQHAQRALAIRPAVADAGTEVEQKSPENRRALRVWLDAKDELQGVLAADEWRLWVRPALLLKLLGKQCLLVALPPNSEIQQAAQERLGLLKGLLGKGGYDVAFTTYPDGWEREQLRTRFPEFYCGMFGVHSRNRE